MSLERWVLHLEEHLAIAKTGQDPEGVHQVRVAGRRLRAWLELAGYRVLQDDLRWLVGAAGPVRDLEVMLQEALPVGFTRWLKQQWHQSRQALLPVLEHPRLAALLRALQHLPALETGPAKTQLERFEQRVLQRARIWKQRQEIEDMHALRRALRRLRFAREFLQEPTKDLVQLQEALGQVNDLAVRLAWLNRFELAGHRPTVRYRQHLQEQLEAAIAACKPALMDYLHQH